MKRDVATAPHEQCGAKTRSGTPCAKPSGWGTDHVGQGRCRLHGGAVPIKHGRYATVVRDSIATIMARLEQEDEDAKLDLLPEATMIRALAADFVDRYDELRDALVAWNTDEAVAARIEERKPRPQPIPEIQHAVGLLESASRVVEKIHKYRSANAVSQRDLFRVMGEMARVVEVHVKDDDAIRRIQHDWLAIKLA